LSPLGRARRWAAIALRALVVLLLAALLARPMLTRRQDDLTVIADFDETTRRLLVWGLVYSGAGLVPAWRASRRLRRKVF